MAKSKKSPTSSRSAKPSKAKKAKAGRVRLPVLDALMAPLTGKGKRGRKWNRGLLTESALDAVAAGKGRVESPARSPEDLAAAVATMGTKRGRKARRVDETDADLAAAQVDVSKAEAPVRLTRMISDPRLPAVGTTIVRTYKGKEYRVTRLEDRFTFEGRDYPSLSKIAREIIGGAQVNGFAFFGLVPKAEKATS